MSGAAIKSGRVGPPLHDYRIGVGQTCPNCGWHQWYLDRHAASCACCEMALPIDGLSAAADRHRKIHFTNQKEFQNA